MKLKTGEIHLKGMPISRGIAIGTAFLLPCQDDSTQMSSIDVNEIETEILRYRSAIDLGCKELRLLQKRLEEERVVEGVAILESYLQIIKDPLLTNRIENEIRLTRKNAELVLRMAVKDYQQRFNHIKDAFFRERSKDIQDVSKRVLRCLKKSFVTFLAGAPSGSVIFSYELNASDVAEADILCVNAFVTTTGGCTSHAAIVAKAKGLPYVTNISLIGLELNQETIVVVDGRSGDVFLNPTQETIERYNRLKNIVAEHQEKLNCSSGQLAETYDGYVVRLSANIENIEEVDLLHRFGAHGVGLYRSEYGFLTHTSFPNEEEQFQNYRSIVELMRGLPIAIRTFDIGGDKQMLGCEKNLENNPVLGRRAIRFFLQKKEIFKNQLKAILRASIYGDVSILFPMISALSELLEAKKLLSEAQAELSDLSIPFARGVRIGCMIEVPSAAIIADLLAKECDFLSIGTNDLVQYSLAVDRGNHTISELYTPAHPSVIRLIKLVVHEANAEGVPLTVCGEIAADPRFTPLLLGLGVHELSVAPRHIPAIKNAVRSTSIVEAIALAERVMTLSSASDIQTFLSEEYNRLVPDDCFYNTKDC